MSVHIVEDDVAVLDSMKMFIEGLGYKVQGYARADCFFKKTLPTETDTVVVDLCLPGIHGTQLIRWLKALRDGPRIIAISGQTEIAIKDQMKDLPDVRLIRKPVIDSDLTNLLNLDL